MARLKTLWRWGLAGCAAALLLAFAAPADAAIYWGSGSPLGRAALDGSSAEDAFVGYNPNPVGGQGVACGGVAVDATHVYWTEPVAGTIGRANLDGSAPNYAWITGAQNPCGIAVDGTHVYWGNFTGNTIGRANIDGSAPDQAFVSGTGDACGVAVDSKFIYWASASGHYVSRALRLSGTTGPHLIDGEANEDFCGVAVDGTHLFWGSFDESIGRMNLNGANSEPSFITGLRSPCGIAAHGGRIYWIESWARGAVGSANVDGTDVKRGMLTTGDGFPCGLAADGLDVSRPVPPPASQFSIGKARYDKKRGAAYLPLDLPDGGYLHVRPSAGMAWALLPDRSKSEMLSSGGRKWLKLWPGKGSNGRRIRRELRRRGRTSFVVEIEYAASGLGLIRKGKRTPLFLHRG